MSGLEQPSADERTPSERSDAAFDSRIVKSSGWVALSYMTRSGLAMVSVLILARLLEPKAFGVVALASMFVLVVQYSQGAGIASALIYKRDDVKRGAATVLVFSSLAGLPLYAATYFLAPLFADVVNAPAVTDVLRVLGVVVVIQGLGVAPGAILERELNFRLKARADVAASVTQAAVAVGTAFGGAGVWSLVAGQLAGTAVQTAASWLLVPDRPTPRGADWRILRDLLRYGRFVSASNLLSLFNATVQNVVVSRVLGATALGYYWVAFRIANMSSEAIGYVINRVMLPAYSIMQDDRAASRRVFLQNLQRVALFALPISVTLAVAANPIVRGLLGEKWAPIETPLRIIAAYSLVRALSASAGPVMMGAGKPQLVALWALPHMITIVPALIFFTRWLGMTGAALAMLVSFSLSGVPALIVAFRLVELPVRDVGRALAPLLACSALLALVLGLLEFASDPMPPLLALLVIGVCTPVVYLATTLTLARTTVAPIWASLRASKSLT